MTEYKFKIHYPNAIHKHTVRLERNVMGHKIMVSVLEDGELVRNYYTLFGRFTLNRAKEYLQDAVFGHRIEYPITN